MPAKILSRGQQAITLQTSHIKRPVLIGRAFAARPAASTAAHDASYDLPKSFGKFAKQFPWQPAKSLAVTRLDPVATLNTFSFTFR
jgi:hypothetical protein